MGRWITLGQAESGRVGHSEGPILAGLHYKQHSMALRRGFDTVGELVQSNMAIFALRVNRMA